MPILRKKNLVHWEINSCPAHYAQQFIGGKWRIAILWSLRSGCKRCGQIKMELGTISEKMLIQELKHFQKSGIIKRKSYHEMPPRVEYSLSDRGVSLITLIEQIIRWEEIDKKKYVSH